MVLGSRRWSPIGESLFETTTNRVQDGVSPHFVEQRIQENKDVLDKACDTRKDYSVKQSKNVINPG